MAAREFHGIIRNEWQHPLLLVDSGLRSIGGGIFKQDPANGANPVDPGQEGAWYSESDNILTGTAGHAIWTTKGYRNSNEFIRIGWSVPWIPAGDLTTAGVSTSDPRESFSSGKAPELEVETRLYTQDDDTGEVLAQGAYLAPYVATLPWSWAIHLFVNPSSVDHPHVKFIVRQFQGPARSPLQFPSTAATRQDEVVMQTFRYRAELAAQQGFVGAFPNFHEAARGVDVVGGTIFLSQAEWRDVPLTEIRSVSLRDFGERMRATNEYATRNGFVGGFPNGFHADYGRGVVCGTVLLSKDAAEWRDVNLQALGNVSLDDIPARFRATNDYAVREGFVGGFPNLFHADYGHGIVCGTILIKRGAGEWRDVVIFRGPR